VTTAKPTLHLLCGKIAAGKSTLAAKLSAEPGTILISEDEWLSSLFAEEMATVADFVRCSKKLRAAIAPHIVALLDAGVSVVLDFQANTLESRKWMRKLLEQSQAQHQLHVLNVPDEVCIARLHERNAGGDHPFGATEKQFHQINRHFSPPTPEEGFTIVHYDTAL